MYHLNVFSLTCRSDLLEKVGVTSTGCWVSPLLISLVEQRQLFCWMLLPPSQGWRTDRSSSSVTTTADPSEEEGGGGTGGSVSIGVCSPACGKHWTQRKYKKKVFAGGKEREQVPGNSIL